MPYQAYANPANLFNNTEINPNLVRTAYPGMGAINYTSFGLSAVNYNGLQMAAQHRQTHGLAFGAAYTFSKALGTQGLDPYTNQRKWYYGPLNQDRSHLLSWNFNCAIRRSGCSRAASVPYSAAMSGIGIVTTGAPVTATAARPPRSPIRTLR